MPSGLHNNHFTNQPDLAERELGRGRAARVGLRGGRNKRYTLAERLAARTVKGPACWIVQGYQNPRNGYVQIAERKGSPMLYAHRVAYELAYGPIAAGWVIAHSCDTPNCVNPEHLFLATQRQNILDSIHKGRYNVFGIQKLNAEQVREIRRRYAAGELQRVIAASFNIARNTVSGIISGKSWRHLDESLLERHPGDLQRVG